MVLISRSLFSWTTASRKMGLAEGDIFYCILCTLDVSLLYTNIPTEDGIHACYASGHRKLEEQGPFVSSNQLAKKILELLPPQGHASATGQYQLQMGIQMVVWIPKSLEWSSNMSELSPLCGFAEIPRNKASFSTKTFSDLTINFIYRNRAQPWVRRYTCLR